MPDHLLWKDEFPEIPKAGMIWPWLLVGFLCFLAGIYLVATPIARDRLEPIVSTPTAATAQTPSPRPDSGTIRFAFVDSDHSTFAFAAEAFARRVSEMSRGRIVVQTLPGGLVDGEQKDELALVKEIQAGRLQMGLSTTSPLTNYNADFEVLDLPFLFRDYDHADRVLDGPLGQELAAGLEEKGLKWLGYLEVGFRLYSSTVPLRKLEDFRDKKLRVMQSAAYYRMAQAIGAEPVPAPVDKIYEMIQKGYIDIADRTYPTFWDFKLYELQKYIAETRHTYSTKAILVNKTFFESLPEEDRQILEEAAHSVQRLQRQEQRKADQQVKARCLAENIEVVELSETEREKFLTAVAPMYEEYRSLGNPALLDRIQALSVAPETPSPVGTPGSGEGTPGEASPPEPTGSPGASSAR
ncbi:MAG: TRAP transporter substrate-binding protein DctP [Armatimonadetes bacterium]|nr:TRAP transporter substrate-binding protein DctP [Armatimonadota bacterium]